MVATRPGSWRVLVADHSQEVRTFLAARLEKAGHRAVVVEDGATALRQIEQGQVDVALLDVTLPRMTGLQVLKKARQTAPDLPILLYSALGGLTMAVEAVKYDADDFLTMPLQADTLDFLIQKALATRQTRKEHALRRELEGRLRHAQKLESIGKLTAGVAHDLNNLMTVVLSHSHTLSTRLAVPEPLRETLDELQHAADRASTLARNLLDFGRKHKTDAVRVDLVAVVRDMEGMLSRVLGKHCRLRTDVPVTPLFIRAGLGCVEQVLMNLVLNARDAMPDGGEIVISARSVEPAGAQPRNGQASPAAGEKASAHLAVPPLGPLSLVTGERGKPIHDAPLPFFPPASNNHNPLAPAARNNHNHLAPALRDTCHPLSPAARDNHKPVALAPRDAHNPFSPTASNTCHCLRNGAAERSDGAASRYVCLTVADTGVGMDESTRARLFEPFFTTKDPGQGTGLGLSIVRDIVEECGGRIDADSAPGQGTTFALHFPEWAEATEAPAASGANGAPPVGGRETILLVEDEGAVRWVVSATLRSQGYTVLEAGDGPEAMPLVANHAGKIDLLMTDLSLPHMGGEELAQRLQAERDDLRVLFISGYYEGAQSLSSRHPHCSFLQKPFTPEVLANKVRELLDA
jgi:signal transduction histidine kinase